MARTSYIDIMPELENQFFTGIRSGDRFQFARVGRKYALLSRKRKVGVSQRSLLPQIAALWAGLSGAEKTAWTNAAAEMNLNGWRLFVQDTAARIINDMSGVATSSLLHQSWVGNVHIVEPAVEAKIVQIHPHFYWVSQKVVGKKSVYEPVLVTEDLALPVTISLNYKSDLTSQGGGAFAKMYARFWYSYQGVNLYDELIINLDLLHDWQYAEAVISSLQSIVIRYDLYIHLYNLRGDLFFDNIKVIHSGQNWARDPFCKDINQGFTRAFYQIPKHWAAVTLPEGAYFESIYKDF